MGETHVTHVTDRRIERANRTRDNIVDALLMLIDEGNFRPTAREIAARASVSLRSLYVHFDDVEALFHAAAIRHMVRLAEEPCTELVTTGSVEDRLTALVERRTEFYEKGANVHQAALLQEPFSPALHSILEEARSAGRAELDKVFGPELSRRKAGHKRAALDVVASPASWRQLRKHHGLSVEAAKAVMCDLIRAVLDQDRTTGESQGNHRAKAKSGR